MNNNQRRGIVHHLKGTGAKTNWGTLNFEQRSKCRRGRALNGEKRQFWAGWAFAKDEFGGTLNLGLRENSPRNPRWADVQGSEKPAKELPYPKEVERG